MGNKKNRNKNRTATRNNNVQSVSTVEGQKTAEATSSTEAAITAAESAPSVKDGSAFGLVNNNGQNAVPMRTVMKPVSNQSTVKNESVEAKSQQVSEKKKTDDELKLFVFPADTTDIRKLFALYCQDARIKHFGFTCDENGNLKDIIFEVPASEMVNINPDMLQFVK